METALVRAFLRRTDSRGSDIRLSTGLPFRPRAWPRVAVPASLWNWKVLRSFPFRRPQHINELELQALVELLKWRGRCASLINSRFLVLVDSQVVLAVATKGRSSARRLQRILLRYNGLVLASFAYPILGYVRSADNPADLPSRYKW